MDAVRGDLDAAPPERLIARAAELRAERESAREAARSVPNHELARVAELRAAVVRADDGAQDAEGREAHLGGRLVSIPAWRRGERAEVRAGIERARRDVERHRIDGRAAREKLTRLRPVVERSLGVERARQRAHELGEELAVIELRLDPWLASADDRSRGRPIPTNDRGQPAIERDLGRGR